MLFIPPTDAELSSYNAIKYKNDFAEHYSLTMMHAKSSTYPIFSKEELPFSQKSNFITTDIKINDDDFMISNLSTWENEFDEFDIEDVSIKLLVNDSFSLKSKITKIDHFTPQIIID